MVADVAGDEGTAEMITGRLKGTRENRVDAALAA